MKTGMIAAETIADRVKGDKELEAQEMSEFQDRVNNSWVIPGLKATRNFQAGFKKSLWAGLA